MSPGIFREKNRDDAGVPGRWPGGACDGFEGQVPAWWSSQSARRPPPMAMTPFSLALWSTPRSRASTRLRRVTLRSRALKASGSSVNSGFRKAPPWRSGKLLRPRSGLSDFKPKEKVDVIGISKGRGFAGVVKRHHFRGSDATHGSMFHRAPGSIGASSFPSRVFPGMRMGGHMGTDRVTVRNLEIVEVDTEDNVILVKGAVPGPNGGYVIVRRAKK